MDNTPEFTRMVERINRVSGTLPDKAATIAVNFSKERFRQGNWFDNSPEPWKKRKPSRRPSRTENRAILVKTARLLRSIRKIRTGKDFAIIGSDVPYAEVHNEGLTIRATANVPTHHVKAHRRKAHTRHRDGRTESVKAASVEAHTVKAHKRKMNFKMPQRRFLGQSAELDRRIERMMTQEFTKAITGGNNHG